MTTSPRKIDSGMKRDALRASAFFHAMPTEELDQIIGFASERRYPRGATIVSKGEPGTSMMAILAGRCRAGNVSSEGKEVTLNVMGPGEILGEIALLDGKPRSADVVALEDTTVMVIERNTFLPFVMRNERMMERLLIVLCDRLRRTSLALEEIALFDLPARLARLILKLAEDYGRPLPPGSPSGVGTRIDIKMSQRDLSTLVASSRESVNKQLRIWREAGIVDLIDGHLIVRTPKALTALFE
jgi:CRP-like cAMP-binding protein